MHASRQRHGSHSMSCLLDRHQRFLQSFSQLIVWWPWSRQKVNELLLFGRHQRFFQSCQVLPRLDSDEVQQVLVGLVVVRHVEQVLILLVGDDVMLTEVILHDTAIDLLSQEVFVLVQSLESSRTRRREVICEKVVPGCY